MSVPIPAHAPITAHQCHFQFEIRGTIDRPLKLSHHVASDYVLSPVLNTENHQLTLLIFIYHQLTLLIFIYSPLGRWAYSISYLRGDYTTHFGNFIFYYNFLTNSLKFIKVYIIRKGISQGRQLLWYYTFTKNQHFWENHKKTHFFATFL